MGEGVILSHRGTGESEGSHECPMSHYESRCEATSQRESLPVPDQPLLEREGRKENWTSRDMPTRRPGQSSRRAWRTPHALSPGLFPRTCCIHPHSVTPWRLQEHRMRRKLASEPSPCTENMLPNGSAGRSWSESGPWDTPSGC